MATLTESSKQLTGMSSRVQEILSLYHKASGKQKAKYESELQQLQLTIAESVTNEPGLAFMAKDLHKKVSSALTLIEGDDYMADEEPEDEEEEIPMEGKKKYKKEMKPRQLEQEMDYTAPPEMDNDDTEPQEEPYDTPEMSYNDEEEEFSAEERGDMSYEQNEVEPNDIDMNYDDMEEQDPDEDMLVDPEVEREGMYEQGDDDEEEDEYNDDEMEEQHAKENPTMTNYNKNPHSPDPLDLGSIPRQKLPGDGMKVANESWQKRTKAAYGLSHRGLPGMTESKSIKVENVDMDDEEPLPPDEEYEEQDDMEDMDDKEKEMWTDMEPQEEQDDELEPPLDMELSDEGYEDEMEEEHNDEYLDGDELEADDDMEYDDEDMYADPEKSKMEAIRRVKEGSKKVLQEQDTHKGGKIKIAKGGAYVNTGTVDPKMPLDADGYMGDDGDWGSPSKTTGVGADEEDSYQDTKRTKGKKKDKGMNKYKESTKTKKARVVKEHYRAEFSCRCGNKAKSFYRPTTIAERAVKKTCSRCSNPMKLEMLHTARKVKAKTVQEALRLLTKGDIIRKYNGAIKTTQNALSEAHRLKKQRNIAIGKLAESIRKVETYKMRTVLANAIQENAKLKNFVKELSIAESVEDLLARISMVEKVQRQVQPKRQKPQPRKQIKERVKAKKLPVKKESKTPSNLKDKKAKEAKRLEEAQLVLTKSLITKKKGWK